MKFSIVTIFPGMMQSFLEHGLLAKALANNLLDVEIFDLRDFSGNKHRKIDDRPFGGGPGMVLMPQPLFDVCRYIQSKNEGRIILFSAYGSVLNQREVKRLARFEHLILICGRYEGVDQRFIDSCVDEEISIGEYVLMGGEIAAQVLIESVGRMIEGVVGNPESVKKDSFFLADQLACPQYTQPRVFSGQSVPDVLLSGDHKKINQWRKLNQKRKKS